MKRHQDVVLQQRVGPRPVVADGHLEALERVRRPNEQHEEEQHDHEHGEQRPAKQRVVDTVAELHHRGDHVAVEDERPQDDRALERRPQGREIEQRRRSARAVLGNEGHAEVTRDERTFHDHERSERAGKREPRIPAPDPHQLGSTLDEAGADRDHSHTGRREAEHVRRAAEGGVHFAAPLDTATPGAVLPGVLPPSSACCKRALFFDS